MLQKIKKISIVLFALTLILVIVSCGKKTDPAKPTPTPSDTVQTTVPTESEPTPTVTPGSPTPIPSDTEVPPTETEVPPTETEVPPTPTPVVKYTVKFMDAEAVLESVEVETGEKVSQIANPTKEGFIFLGWYLNDVEYDFNEPVTGNLTLVAKWEEEIVVVDKVTVTFDSQGGTVVEAIEVDKGSVVTEPAAPTKEGFTFLGWFLNDVEFDFNNEVEENLTLVAKWDEVIVPTYVAVIGETFYESITEAIANAEFGDTIYLMGGDHETPFTVDKNGLKFASVEGQTAVIKTKVTVGPNTVGLTFDGLEFTGDAYIHAPNNLDQFVFVNNNVHDITIEASGYAPANRIDVNAFIRIYSFAGSNTTGDVLIDNNEFKNIEAIIISIDRTSIGKEVIITNNVFHNFVTGAVRFDGGYNNGTITIQQNMFKHDVAGENLGVITFRCYAPSAGNLQVISILENTFINVGSDEIAIDTVNGHPGSGVITFSTFNDQPTEVYINRNVFIDTTRAIHFRNAGAIADLSADFSDNVFENNNDYYLHQVRVYNPAPEANFQNNFFIDADGNPITDLAEIGAKIINNNSYNQIIKSYEEKMVRELIDKIDEVDLYVNLELNELSEDIIVNGKSFTYGVDAFNSISAALAVISEGQTLLLADGTYEDDFIINVSNIKIIGPNYDTLTVDTLREPEAILKGQITISGAVNTEFNGLKFEGSARIINDGSVEGLIFTHNIVDSGLAATSGGIVDGFIKLLALTNNVTHSNIIMINNAFDYNNPASAPRYLLGSNIVDLYVINNEFISSFDFFTDVIRITGTNLTNEGGIGLEGKFYIYSNKFKNVGQSAIFVTKYGKLDAKITNNDFDNINTSAVRFRFTSDTTDESSIYYTFNKLTINEVDVGYNTSGLRIERAGTDLVVVANYNHFTTIPANYYFLLPETITSDARYNFYEAADEFVPASNKFTAGVDYSGYYTSIEDLPKYDEKLVIEMTEISILNKITTIKELEYHTLEVSYLPENTTNSKLTFSSSDENIAIVDGYGKVLAINEGVVTIKVASQANPDVYDEMVITVEPRERIEVSYEGSTVLEVNQTLQLNVTKYGSDKEITYSSSDSSIATVDEFGLVTAVAEGEVIITVALGDVMNYSLDFTVFAEGTLNDLLRYLIENSENTVSSEVIRYIGSDDGSLDYDHDIVPSVLAYLFNDEISINKNMLSPTAPNHSGTKMNSVEWIVIHDTANTSTTAGAGANSNWVTNPANTGTSWHYTVGNDGWYQQLEHDDVGWHASDGSNEAGFTDTGIIADELKPKLTISENGKYVVKGIETDVSAPLVNGQLPKTSNIVSEGLWAVVINGTYHIPNTRYSTLNGGGIMLNGGNRNGIGIETAVNRTSDMWLSWQRVAKLVASLLIEHDLELDRVTFHNHFSAKICPRTAIQSNNIDSLLKMIEVEYNILKNYSNYEIEFTSHNPSILNNKGRIISIPDVDTVVSYTIKVTDELEVSYEVTLNTLVKGRYS